MAQTRTGCRASDRSCFQLCLEVELGGVGGGIGFNQVLQQTQPTKCREGDDRHGLQCEKRSVRAGQEVWQKQTGSDPFACCRLVERGYSSTVWELYE